MPIQLEVYPVWCNFLRSATLSAELSLQQVGIKVLLGHYCPKILFSHGFRGIESWSRFTMRTFLFLSITYLWIGNTDPWGEGSRLINSSIYRALLDANTINSCFRYWYRNHRKLSLSFLRHWYERNEQSLAVMYMMTTPIRNRSLCDAIVQNTGCRLLAAAPVMRISTY
jgi:hypothetical protein